MSHFRVAVFANDPSEFESLLAPYSETDETYYKFHVLTDSEMDDLRNRYENMEDKTDSFERFLTDIGYVIDLTSGEIGYSSNPNAKWDWYSLNGGDWQFELLPGEALDENGNGRKNQYDYVNPDYSKAKSTRHWKDMKELSESKDDDEDKRFAAQFMMENPDLDQYLNECYWNAPYAFITPDGKWHAPGTVGWFAFSDDTAESWKSYLKEWTDWLSSDQNPYVNFVDCHI